MKSLAASWTLQNPNINFSKDLSTNLTKDVIYPIINTVIRQQTNQVQSSSQNKTDSPNAESVYWNKI